MQWSGPSVPVGLTVRPVDLKINCPDCGVLLTLDCIGCKLPSQPQDPPGVIRFFIQALYSKPCDCFLARLERLPIIALTDPAFARN